ncbi:MAG TPA: hypothetical protein VKT22_15790 [Steroidobacteraceae bacterium]|nr:hypothetical protein [Steroidobacteraceae bacterium]
MSGFLVALSAAPRAQGAVSMLPPPITPDDGDTYQFYLSDQETYDSNLYRLPSDTPASGTVAIPNPSKSDYYNTASAGANGQLVRGRQIFDLDLRADENRFAHNTLLDNFAYSGDLLWNWRASGYFSGTAGVIYNHALAGFDETRYLGKDLVNSATYNGSARYQVGPRWAVYGNVSDLNITHSAEAAHLQNYKYESGTAGAEFATDLNDSIALEYHYANGKYPSGTLNSENGVTFSPDFHDQLAQIVIKYATSDKTQLTGNLGYIQRTYPNTDFGSFKGAQGRVTLNWQATEKTQLIAAVWRELHAYLVSEADYFISTGGSLTPTWAATSKIRLSLLLAYENQKYIPESSAVLAPTTPVVPPSGNLTAKLKTAGGELDWTPRDNWIVKLSIHYQDRSSNQPLYTFNDDLATVGVLYKIH